MLEQKEFKLKRIVNFMKQNLSVVDLIFIFMGYFVGIYIATTTITIHPNSNFFNILILISLALMTSFISYKLVRSLK